MHKIICHLLILLSATFCVLANPVSYSVSSLIEKKLVVGQSISIHGFYVLDAIYQDEKSASEMSTEYALVSLPGEFSDDFYKYCFEKNVVLKAKIGLTSRNEMILMNVSSIKPVDMPSLNCMSFLKNK